MPGFFPIQTETSLTLSVKQSRKKPDAASRRVFDFKSGKAAAPLHAPWSRSIAERTLRRVLQPSVRWRCWPLPSSSRPLRSPSQWPQSRSTCSPRSLVFLLMLYLHPLHVSITRTTRLCPTRLQTSPALFVSQTHTLIRTRYAFTRASRS